MCERYARMSPGSGDCDCSGAGADDDDDVEGVPGTCGCGEPCAQSTAPAETASAESAQPGMLRMVPSYAYRRGRSRAKTACHRRFFAAARARVRAAWNRKWNGGGTDSPRHPGA